jgi:hypothetical protein
MKKTNFFHVQEFFVNCIKNFNKFNTCKNQKLTNEKDDQLNYYPIYCSFF